MITFVCVFNGSTMNSFCCNGVYIGICFPMTRGASRHLADRCPGSHPLSEMPTLRHCRAAVGSATGPGNGESQYALVMIHHA